MPFPPSRVEELFQTAAKEGRLAHAYLLTGAPPAELESLGKGLAANLLDADLEGHPDFFVLRPESKSRRVSIAQVRSLEHSLSRRPHKAPLKVALILEAERMCLPPAEAANAFLKTLEEPPDHSLLILTSDRPEQLLPTVRSRCLTFPILPDKHPAPIEGIDELTRLWAESSEPTPLAAYRRASILQSFLLSTRDRLNAQSEQEVEDEEGDENESAQSATLAGQLVRVREDIITHLIRSAWGRAQSSLRPEIVREVDSLEKLRLALARNIDPTLAIEVSCLRIAGLT
jgi:DNA polymerase-3 subunit delta'